MGITSIVSEWGYNLQITGSDADPEDERREILKVIDSGCCGLIAYPSQGEENIDLFVSLIKQKFPLVMVDRYFPQMSSDCVLNDDEKGGYELTQALIDQGHGRIAVVQHYEVHTSSVNDRIKGYQRALEENGIPFDKNLLWMDIYPEPKLVQNYSTVVSVRNSLIKLVNQYEPTALLAINQDTAQHVANDLHVIQSEYILTGKNGKDHIQGVSSIATFSFSDHLVMDPFKLTLAYQSGKILGSEAAKLLIQRMNRPASGETTTIRVPVTIIPAKREEPIEI
jgi:GntR family transcriptional regulator of arabinose operon